MSKVSRKRRAEPDIADDTDLLNGDSDDDFDPRELLAVKQIAKKSKTQQRTAAVKPSKAAPKAASQPSKAPKTAAAMSTRNSASNGHATANNDDGEDDDEDEDDMDGISAPEDSADAEDDGHEDADDDDEEGVETATHEELEALKRGKKPQREAKQFINNKAGLTAKLADIALPSSWPWLETFLLPTSTPLLIPDPHDDLQRESQFYAATEAATLAGLHLLHQQRIPYLRPSDFYAEMLKPDAHMARVKDALIREKSRMEAVSARKKEQTAKRFAKQVQVQRVQEKQKEKRDALDAVAQQRHQAKHSSSVRSEHSTLPGVDEAMQQVKQRELAKRGKKREKKDEKYGFGGKKKRVKTNDRDSARDVSGFRGRENREMFDDMQDMKPGRGGRGRGGGRGGFSSRGRGGGGRGGGVGGRGGGGGTRGRGRGGNRPGRARRQSSRT